MSNGCPTCKAVLCCDDNPFVYSLVKGRVYENDQVSVNFECPEGLSCQSGIYTIPAGTIQLPITGGSPLRLQCCQSEIVQNVPTGATEEEIGEIAQAMVNECARQLALCTANRTVRSVFMNQSVTSNPCASTGRLLGWLGPTPPVFNPVISLVNGILVMQAGVFSSNISQSTATQLAQTFLDNFGISLVFQGVLECGYWNEELTCPDSDPPIVIPAFTVFSNVSQEAANAAAIAAGCPSSCCVSPDSTIGGLGFPNYLTYDDQNDLVFVACQTQGVLAIDPATDTVVGTRFTAGTTYFGGVIYVPTTNRVYCCANVGGVDVWQIINPLTMALVGTVTPPAGYTFLGNLQPTWDPTGQRLLVAGRRTAGFLPAILQIDVNTGTSSTGFLAANSFDTIEFPGACDTTRNRFVFKMANFGAGIVELVILNSALASTGTTSLGAGSASGTTGDVLYVPEVDKLFFSGITGAGDEFLQLNADTVTVEQTISSTRGSIWFSEDCKIVFQRTVDFVVQWDYVAEETECIQGLAGFGLGATTETATGKCYVVSQGGPGTVESLSPP